MGLELQIALIHHAAAASINLPLPGLHSLKGEWRCSWQTCPTSQGVVSSVRSSSNGADCRIDIGPNWLGSTCGHVARGAPPYTSLTKEEAIRFREFSDGRWAIR
jgi:hypothetical protein